MKGKSILFLTFLLITAFSMHAMAVDVKISGEYYAAGLYLDKTTFKKGTATDGPSTAFFFQRLRVRTDFIVSPGLTLVTRFDALERSWGATRSTPGSAPDSLSAGTRAENENIAFDWAYLNYQSPIGQLRVGIVPEGTWGTVAFNSSDVIGKVQWTGKFGNFSTSAYIAKSVDLSYSAVNTSAAASDQDMDKYVLNFRYLTKDFEGGLLYQYRRMATNKALPGGSFVSPNVLTGHGLNPYVKAKLGPVYMEAEIQYAFGTIKFENGGRGPFNAGDINADNLTAYVNVAADFGKVYFGVQGVYVSGDNPKTNDRLEGGIIDGGNDYNPCLIMFNYDRWYWVGTIPGHANSRNNSPMTNAWFGQGRVGLRPIAGLDILASVAYALADQKPFATTGNPATEYLSNQYGWEVDMTATYKITSNLSYMLGFGYWFVGDYYKANTTNDVNNEFLVLNKLTLTF